MKKCLLAILAVICFSTISFSQAPEGDLILVPDIPIIECISVDSNYSQFQITAGAIGATQVWNFMGENNRLGFYVSQNGYTGKNPSLTYGHKVTVNLTIVYFDRTEKHFGRDFVFSYLTGKYEPTGNTYHLF